jgi:potassium efflux system protein
VAVVLFLVGIGVTRGVQRWLEVKFLPHTRLDTGLQNSIKTSLGYVGFLVAVSLSLSHLGLSVERLAIVAGALSVGIGFGLQSIVNNFVSGLILLWERAIRVGDWIVVGEEQGYVRRINVRSTEIETFDRATIIVPNANLVSGVVKNWLRNDHVGRIRLPFTVPITIDPEKVRDILIAAAKGHDHVLSIPSPQVVFAQVGETNLKLELLCFIEDVEMSQRVSSDLLFEIFKGLRDLGIGAPAPPPTVTSPALDKLDAWLSSKMADPPGQRRTAAND